MQKTAIITGIRGMDASHLADLLLSKDYKVYGLKRRSTANDLGCSAHLENEKNLEIFEGDLLDPSSLSKLCKLAKADEFYSLAAMSHVHTSFEQPVYTAECTGIGPLNCLEAIRSSGYHTKFLQASSSEMFGGVSGERFVNEEKSFHPRSPYGSAKVFAFHTCVNYREAYKMFVCNSICFNHEGPRRHQSFVTRKISLAVANIKAGKQDKLYLGNLNSKRDWGASVDFVEGMYLMLQHSQPEDFVLATGETHSIKEFCDIAFDYAGLDHYTKYVEIDPRFYRPAEADVLLGDYSKARHILGWKPKVKFVDLVKQMVKSDCKSLGIEIEDGHLKIE